MIYQNRMSTLFPRTLMTANYGKSLLTWILIGLLIFSLIFFTSTQEHKEMQIVEPINYDKLPTRVSNFI
jgi:hypothetical protein